MDPNQWRHTHFCPVHGSIYMCDESHDPEVDLDIHCCSDCKTPFIGNRSVLKDWVMRLTLREQGTLLTAIRGCDLTPKYPLDSPERSIVAAIRYAVMVPFDLREVDSESGCFMLSRPPALFKPSSIGHYPQHWHSHILHAIEVIGYRHPCHAIAAQWQEIYHSMVSSLHLNPESHEDMHYRPDQGQNS